MKRRLLLLLFHRVLGLRPLVNTELRSSLLRRLGATVGRKVFLAPRVRIAIPKLFKVGDDTSIGEGVLVDGWAPVDIGSHVIIASKVELLTGGHDIHDPHFRGK